MALDMDTVNAILRRSEDGEGVIAVIRSMGLDEDATLEGLKPYHDMLKAAKVVQRARKAEKDKKDKEA